MTFSEATNGKWLDILPRFGISPEYLKDRHGPCPLCAGRDRFRYDGEEKGTGSWICNQCGAGAGVKLVALINGWDRKKACREIMRYVDERNPQARQPRPRQKSDRWKRTWDQAVPLDGTDPASTYLRARLGWWQPGLAWADLPYFDDGRVVGTYPAMVAPVVGPGGDMRTVHVTYIEGGRKADVPSPRKMLSSAGQGAAVRLAPVGAELGIAEGIETALAAWAIFGVPTWAALNARMLETWQPPTGTREVVIYADNDESLTGQAAAYAIGKRLRSKGIVANVAVPETTGADWLDVYQAAHPPRRESC